MIFIFCVVPKNIVCVLTDKSSVIWKVVNSLRKHTVQVNFIDNNAANEPTVSTFMRARDLLISQQIIDSL